MKLLYKKHEKKLLLLFFLLPTAIAIVAQVPGTPYALTALSTAGSFTGRTCFDVAQVNDADQCGKLTYRNNETLAVNGTRADFTNTLTRNQTYTLTPSGTVSNVRFYFVEASPYEGLIIESMTGGNPGNHITAATPVTCSVVYKADLNNRASGTKNADALTVDIYAVYNDNAYGTGTDKSVKLTVRIQDCACCGAYTLSGRWLSFLCYNLGADPTLITPDQIKNAPITSTYGNMYQWGKRIGRPIPSSPGDWPAEINPDPDGGGGNPDNLAWGFGGSKTDNDPCPDNSRVPSFDEMLDLIMSVYTYPPPMATQTAIYTKSAVGTEGLQIGEYLFFPFSRSVAPDGSWLFNPHVYWTRDWQTRDRGIGLALLSKYNPIYWYYDESWFMRSGGAAVRCVTE